MEIGYQDVVVKSRRWWGDGERIRAGEYPALKGL